MDTINWWKLNVYQGLNVNTSKCTKWTPLHRGESQLDAIIEENNTEGTAEARPVKPENEDAMYDTD